MHLRPRRFGKSLLLAVLDAYYNIEFKDEFESLFRDTYIGKNPTSEVNSYYVLKFDFSAVSIEDVEYSFKHYVANQLQLFIEKYNNR